MVQDLRWFRMDNGGWEEGDEKLKERWKCGLRVNMGGGGGKDRYQMEGTGDWVGLDGK